YRSMNIDYFFFQAEDGIRDRNVTGVQTCALPILASPNKRRSTLRPDFRSRGSSIPLAQPDFGPRGIPGWFPPRSTARWFHQQMQIGRASCRERVSDVEMRGKMKKKEY